MAILTNIHSISVIGWKLIDELSNIQQFHYKNTGKFKLTFEHKKYYVKLYLFLIYKEI